MKLNLKCIKDILLTVQLHGNVIYPSNNYSELSDYSTQEVIYHIKQCIVNNLFVKHREYIDGGFALMDLSPKGHEFLSSISSNNSFQKIVRKIAELGIDTLPSILTFISNISK